MGPFALPVPAYQLPYNKSRARKRKRTNGADDEIVEDDDVGGNRASFTSTPAASASSLPADSINPLSHSPDTLRQFAVAGLAPEEEVPSKIYPKFPHKSISSRNAFSLKRGGNTRKKGRMSALTSGSEADVDTDVSDSHMSRPTRGDGGDNNNTNQEHGGDDEEEEEEEEDDGFQMNYSARMRHLNTLTAIMHRCLHEGDIPRAKRAFNLLIHTKEVDIRVNDMWNIGAEILMREGEKQQQQQQQKDAGKGKQHAEEEDSGWALGQPPADNAEEEDEEGSSSWDPRRPPLPQLPYRWGSAANLEKVREYFQSLIQSYPYDQHRPHMTSAVDFWPALFSIEIYNLDAEFKKAQRQLESKEDDDDDDDEQGTPPRSNPSDDNNDDDEHEEDSETRHLRRRQDARRARRHAARDEIRAQTRAAAEKVATRMDLQMENRPYGTHGELLRLRGLLALYIADLYLPSALVARSGLGKRRGAGAGGGEEEEEEEEEGEGPGRRENSPLGSRRQGPSSSLLLSLHKYAETEEERTTIRQNKVEMEKAKGFFRKMLERGIDVDEWVRRFAEDDDEGGE